MGEQPSDDERYIVQVGETHPALVIVGDSYDVASAPKLEDVSAILEEESEWGLSMVYTIREGHVEIQHETPPTEPYDAWGVVVAFEQSPTELEYEWSGPLVEAIELLNRNLDDIEIWIDAV